MSVQLSQPFTASASQLLGCGCTVGKGAELFELKGGGGAFGTLCRPCLRNSAAQVADLNSVNAR